MKDLLSKHWFSCMFKSNENLDIYFAVLPIFLVVSFIFCLVCTTNVAVYAGLILDSLNKCKKMHFPCKHLPSLVYMYCSRISNVWGKDFLWRTVCLFCQEIVHFYVENNTLGKFYYQVATIQKSAKAFKTQCLSNPFVF